VSQRQPFRSVTEIGVGDACHTQGLGCLRHWWSVKDGLMLRVPLRACPGTPRQGGYVPRAGVWPMANIGCGVQSTEYPQTQAAQTTSAAAAGVFLQFSRISGSFSHLRRRRLVKCFLVEGVFYLARPSGRGLGDWSLARLLRRGRAGLPADDGWASARDSVSRTLCLHWSFLTSVIAAH
jgi:hypothetical protein